MSFRDLSERLAKEVKRVNHELNMERARRQPTLRRTTMGRGKSQSKKSRRVKSEPIGYASDLPKKNTIMKQRRSANALKVQDLTNTLGGMNIDNSTKEILA